MTENKTVLAWLDEMAAMCQPDEIVWIDGSEAQLDELREEAVRTGEMIKLNEEKLPGLQELRTEPLSAHRQRLRQALLTTGWLPMRCMLN